MNWRVPFVASALLFSIVGCALAPNAAAVPDDAMLLSNQTPNPRGMGDPNAPVKMHEYTDYQ